MGFMNWVVSKAMGLPSAGETCDRRVEEILLHNGIKQHSVKMYRGELTAALSNYFGQMIVKRRADLETLKAAHSTKPEGSIVAEVSRNGIAIVEEAIEFYERLHKDWFQRKSELAPAQLDWESKQRIWGTLKK